MEFPPWNTVAQIPSPGLADPSGWKMEDELWSTEVELLVDLLESHRSCIPVSGTTGINHFSL